MSMQSRRDLFQAHRLMTQRAALALLRGEPDVPDQPLRRLNVGTFSGLLVGVIVTGLFLIWGLLGHTGGTLTDQPGTLVIDKQTGTPFVFCNHGGIKLCPVLNYASARLALNSSSLNQETVDQAAIAKFPRGPLIGIPGLPQPLPDASLLIKQPWSVCTAVTITPRSGPQPVTTLAGGIQTGGQPLGSGLLLVQAQGQDWAIWNGQRMAIQSDLLAAVHGPTSPPPVPAAWLNALPQGPPFAAPTIPGRGSTVPNGPTGGPVSVGQVYKVTAVAGNAYYVMLANGLAQITPMQAQLLDFLPGTHETPLSPSQVSGHRSSTSISSGGLPNSPPTLATPPSTVPLCVVYSGGGNVLTRQVETGGRLPPGGVATGAPSGDPSEVNQVALPPDAGALVGAGQGNGVISYFLVTDGRRYALSSTDVAGMLGYTLSQAVRLPEGVVHLIPAGPVMNPVQASETAPSGG